MKISSNCNVEKYIQNTNKQILKNNQSLHSAILHLDCLLGLDSISNSSILSLNDEQIIYYSCKNFVFYNLSTKEYKIINKEVKGCKLQMLKKFDNNIKQNSQSKKKIVIGVYQSDKQSDVVTSKQIFNTYIVVLEIKVDFQSRNSCQSQSRMQWKQIKIHNQPILIQNYQYDPKRAYLYMIITQKFSNSRIQQSKEQNSEKIQQFLWVFDMKKQIYVLKHELRSNTINYHIKYLILQQNCILYFAGKNYFRQWTINFCQKSLKQSNVRNVQRTLKGKNIVEVIQIPKHHIPNLQNDRFQDQQAKSLFSHDKQIMTMNSKIILILSQKQLLLVKSNQILLQTIPQRNMIHKGKQKDNIEKELQNSLNQIYKMKFLFDQYEEMKQKEKNIKNRNVETIVIQKIMFTCMSSYWFKDKSICFAIGTNKNNVLIYEMNDMEVKLFNQYSFENQIPTEKFENIIANDSGEVLLVVNSKHQIYMIDQESQGSEIETHSKSLWGNGQMHQKFLSVDSPSLQNIMCTVGDQGSLKLWSLKNNQRQIIFQEVCKQKPLGATIHPCGMLMAVNFQKQIKLYSILPQQFYEITSIKTNYTSFQLKFSSNGEFIVSNEGNALILYQSFGLKTLGYLEPSDLKFKIVDFKISTDSQHICFRTQDSSVYFQTIEIGQISKWQRMLPAHEQSDQYTCMHFNTYVLNQQKEKENQNNSQNKKVMNLFIGASKHKYMVIYSDFGTNLIAEFPVTDCYIVDMEVYENLLFAATSKGTIRIYHWPILQQNCLIELADSQSKKIKLKPPVFTEYQLWSQKIPIKKLHKLRFNKQLVIFNDFGNLGLVTYQQTKGKKTIYEQIPVQRKKMEQIVNEVFYIKKSESQKRNKLIQKTQNDILKVQNQILRQKIALQRKLEEEQGLIERNFQLKSHIQQQQKLEYVEKEKLIIQELHKEIEKKKKNLQDLKKHIHQDYFDKKNYQKIRNQGQEAEIQKMKKQHKQKILQKIEIHRQNIRDKKKQYWCKVKEAQTQFQKYIQKQFYEKLIKNTENVNNEKKLMRKLSLVNMQSGNKIKTMDQQLMDQIISEYTSKESQQLIIQGLRVEQYQKNNSDLLKQIQRLKKKVQVMEQDDEFMQKQFQRYLEQYNSKRFENLNLHSQVLKMQNQLIERKQILDTKQEIVMLAYQEKQKLQNYRQLVKGSLLKMQSKKQNIREIFNKKQHDLNLIFTELVNQIQKMQSKKTELFKIQRKINLSNKELEENQTKIKKTIEQLKQVKKFLLLERMNQEMQEKSNYQYEQNLLTNINFLKKRLYMQSIKQKKNKQLKKTSLNQILKQNKNLLQECNQLRSEGIQYQNEIKNLSNKLKEANKMISIQSKLKNQKSNVHEQKNQLQIIRELFKMHLRDFDNKRQEQTPKVEILPQQENKNRQFNSGNTSYINDETQLNLLQQQQSVKAFKLSCHKPNVFHDIF